MTMRKLIVASLMLASSVAFADPPKGTGNFRRTEVLKAAGAKHWTTARVEGATAADKHAKGIRLPQNSRVMIVSHDEGKVDFVRAPNDKSVAVHKMGTAEVNRMGLITQKQAGALASKNGGEFGQKGTVKVQNNGLATRNGSFSFTQTAKVSDLKKLNNPGSGTVTVQRSVPYTGNPGETASPVKWGK
jgi:hypothetical protein